MATSGTKEIIGATTRIGRFVAQVVSGAADIGPCVCFSTVDGRPFGDIRLGTALAPVAVDLYESAAVMLGLPICYDLDAYCLNAHELAELRTWANDLVAGAA